MIKTRGALKEFSVISGAALIGQTFNLLIHLFLAKQLGPSKFGEYSYILAIAAMAPVIYGLGMPNSIYRFYNTSNSSKYKDKVVSSGLFVVLGSSLALSSILIFILNSINLDISKAQLLNIILLTFFLSLNNLFLVVLRATRDFKVTSSISIIQPILKFALIFGLFLNDILNISNLIIILLIVEILLLIFTFFNIKQAISIKNICLNTIRSMFKYGLSFIPHKFFTKGQDPLIKSFIMTFIGSEPLGAYALAQKISLPISFLIDKFQFIWGPLKFSIRNKTKDSNVIFSKITSSYVIIISVISSVYMMIPFGAFQFDLIPRFPGALSATFLFIIIASLRGNYYMYGTGAEFGETMKILPFISGAYVGIIILARIFYFEIDLNLRYFFLPIILSELLAIIMIRLYSKRVFSFKISVLSRLTTLLLAFSGLLFIHFPQNWIFMFFGLFYMALAWSNRSDIKNTVKYLNKF